MFGSYKPSMNWPAFGSVPPGVLVDGTSTEYLVKSLALSASCAVPGYFAPVVIQGDTYVDGGIHSPTNADLLAPADLDLVVVVSPMSGAANPRSVDGIVRRRAGRVTRQLRLLRAHGLIQKVAKTHRYQLTVQGRQTITAILSARHTPISQLAKAA